MSNHYEKKFLYVPNNTYKVDYDSDGNVDRRGFDVLCEGFLFKRIRINKNSTIHGDVSTNIVPRL